ncbi:MAG: SDR family NAD(P)-dependent oxidoreductase [Oscillospiraceae bacterium]
MNLGLENKVVGITGAASLKGIGFGIAKAALLEGAKVFICDLNLDALDIAKKELQAFGEVQAYQADVSNEGEVQAMFSEAMTYFGKIDAFVNNAGIYPQGALCEMSAAQWDKVMNVNLRSVFLCAKQAFLCMKNGGGVIINAASYAAVISSAGSGAYAASKSAVFSLTKTMAAEMAPYGIRVNGFIPGVIETGMTQNVVAQNADRILSQIALAKLGQPEDVAGAVLYLMSDVAKYITGTFIEISGGKLCVQNPDYGYKRMQEER